MLKGILIISILVLAFFDLKAQDKTTQKPISDSIELVKTLIRKNGSVTSYGTGIGGTISNQFQRFLYLLNYLNTEEFLELTNDTSACLRIYAYAGLTHSRYKKIALVKTQFQTDSTLVPYMTGCLGGNVRVSSIIPNLKQFYTKKGVTQLLKQQNKEKSFWYTNFVFRN
jgi:hypothetical protein